MCAVMKWSRAAVLMMMRVVTDSTSPSLAWLVVEILQIEKLNLELLELVGKVVVLLEKHSII